MKTKTQNMAIYYIINDSKQYLYSIEDNILLFGFSALESLIFIKKEDALKFKKEIEKNYKTNIKILKQENKKCEIIN